jgi:hypothetical protein
MALSADDMGKAAGRLLETLPGLSAQAREAEGLLKAAGGESTRQLSAIEAALAAVGQHVRDSGAEAGSTVASIEALLARIDATSSETTKAIASRAYTLDAAVTGVLERSSEAFASIGETLKAQAANVEAMVARARTDVDNFGAEGTRAISTRLDVLLGAAAQLKAQFGEQQLLAEQMQLAASAAIADVQSGLQALAARQDEAGQALQARALADLGVLEARLAEMDRARAAATAAMHQGMADGIAAVEARLAQLRAAQAEAGTAMEAGLAANVASIEARLGELRDTQQAAGAALAERMAEEAAEVDRRLAVLRERQNDADAEMRARLQAQIEAMEAQLSALTTRQREAASVLDAAVSDLAGGVEARLAALDARHREVGADMEATANAAIAEIEARLRELKASGEDKLGATSQQIVRTLEELDSVAEALSARHEVTRALEARVNQLLPALTGFTDAAHSELPKLSLAVDEVAGRGQAMIDQLDALAARIDSQAAVLRDSAAAFERDHDAVVGLSQTLAGHFGEARGIVGEIHETTEQTAIAAAARMVENVMQVRQAVNATSDEIRALLAGVVAEAEQSLDNFASTKAEAAFGAPIRLQIAALEEAAVRAADAASGASERVSSRLVELMRTISETEARIDEVDTRMDLRARDTLAARSLRLVDSLNSASIDVARLLAVDVGDGAWQRYLKGDRSIFTRATVRLADKEMSRKIARHFAHDPEFEAEASRYLDQFEELIRRILKDPEGDSFALVMLSSDIGKLYVLLAQAIGRPIARRAA